MFKLILKNGIIAGLIVETAMLITMASGVHGGLLGMALGYLSMLIAFSMIFVGIKKYRDVENGGMINFGQAFVIGFGIAIIASIFYVIGWEIYLFFTNYTFMNEYVAKYIESKRAAGASLEEIAKLQTQMSQMAIQYKNPIFRTLMTFSEILPIGLLVSLICAFILKNPKAFPAK